MKLTQARALQILDSRGMPTIEVRLVCDKGFSAKYSVPAGASRGDNEAIELRDGGKSYGGNGVGKAVKLINEDLQAELLGREFSLQTDFDDWLRTVDPSATKAHLGGNTTLALSGAFAHLQAAHAKTPLWKIFQSFTKQQPAFPRIFANLVNGGKHAPGLDIQEFMVVPKTTRPSEAVAQVYDFHHRLQDELVKRYGDSAKLVGDEGGMAPHGAKSAEILDLLAELRDHSPACELALDVAASSFFADGSYNFEGHKLSSEGWQDTLLTLAREHKIASIEDPFAETDLKSFSRLKDEQPNFYVVGDDVTVTDPKRIAALASDGSITGVIIKPNQIGTISETISAVLTAQQHNLFTIISHRSGETNDTLIIDLAYGMAADGVKIGAPRRGERVAKYNRLLEIEAGL
jgi:enolase